MTRPTPTNPTTAERRALPRSSASACGAVPALPRVPRPASRFSCVFRGFSLIEMLVVISIIGILAGITFPIIAALQEGSRTSGAVNTVSVALDTARNFATRSVTAGFDDVNQDGTAGDLNDGSGYSGAAALFTPGGEIRIVENNPFARFSGAGGSYLELELDNGNGVHNGYKDVPGRDYIVLPDQVGVAGVRRINASTLEYIAPPFAMRFDNNGLLVNRAGSGGSGPFAEDGHVYYDSNTDGRIQASGSGFNLSNPFKVANYDNPIAWDWRGNPTGLAELVGSPPKRLLPYEQMETVIILTVFDLTEFQNAGGWGQADIDGWMKDNARYLFFSKATGVVAR